MATKPTKQHLAVGIQLFKAVENIWVEAHLVKVN